MARQKAEKFAEECGIVKPTYSLFVSLIDECIFSERDRYIIKRFMLDDVTAERLVDEVAEKFPERPLEYRQMKRVIRKCKNTISRYV